MMKNISQFITYINIHICRKITANYFFVSLKWISLNFLNFTFNISLSINTTIKFQQGNSKIQFLLYLGLTKCTVAFSRVHCKIPTGRSPPYPPRPSSNCSWCWKFMSKENLPWLFVGNKITSRATEHCSFYHCTQERPWIQHKDVSSTNSCCFLFWNFSREKNSHCSFIIFCFIVMWVKGKTNILDIEG